MDSAWTLHSERILKDSGWILDLDMLGKTGWILRGFWSESGWILELEMLI